MESSANGKGEPKSRGERRVEFLRDLHSVVERKGRDKGGVKADARLLAAWKEIEKMATNAQVPDAATLLKHLEYQNDNVASALATSRAKMIAERSSRIGILKRSAQVLEEFGAGEAGQKEDSGKHPRPREIPLAEFDPKKVKLIENSGKVLRRNTLYIKLLKRQFG